MALTLGQCHLRGTHETPTSALVLATQATCPMTPAHLTPEAESRAPGEGGVLEQLQSPRNPLVPRAVLLLPHRHGSER